MTRRSGASAARETFDLGPTRLYVVAANAAATILEGELQPGAGSGWHTHGREDETIIVAAGKLVVQNGERRELEAGDAHVVPRGTRHAFANEGETPARVYFICAPGGLEGFFRAIAAGVPPEEAAAEAGLQFG